MNRPATPPPGFARSCSGADCPRQSAALPGEGRPEHSPSKLGEDLEAGKVAVEALLAADEAEAERIVAEMGEAALRRLCEDWPGWRHERQVEPDGDWRVWVMHGGRGVGKTRLGSEWVSEYARTHPGATIALVAATVEEARRGMVERPRSGLLAVARSDEIGAMLWEPSLKRLRFASGAEAFLYSGAHADGLRGAEHHIAWCDEFAKWRQARAAWDNLQLGLRLGTRPRTLVTTTPRALAALRQLLAEPGVVATRGASWDNPHLARAAIAALRRMHGGTRFGRQELEGEMFEDLEGALWERGTVEKQRSGGDVLQGFRRIVVGVDPPTSNEGTCGIVVCGTDSRGRGYVLADLSATGLSPEGWAQRVAAAAEAWGTHRIVAEANNGGRMVEAVLRAAGTGLPAKLVYAADGKVARAAPVAALFESGRAWFAGRFPELEDQLCGLTWDGGYHGPGASPDRADAMVWALTELMLGRPRAEPRVTAL